MIKNIARFFVSLLLIITLPIYGREKKKKLYSPFATLKNKAQEHIQKNNETRTAYREEMMQTGKNKRLKRIYEQEEFNKRRNNYKSMNLEQLDGLKKELITRDDIEQAIKIAERQLTLATDYGIIRDLRLEIADLNYDLGLYEKAEKLFEEFLTLYPSATTSEYAHNKSICSASMQLCHFECDQEAAKRALKKINEFCSKGTYSDHLCNVESIRSECSANILRNEIAVLKFNIQRNCLKGADIRLKHIEKEYALIAQDCLINIKLLREYLNGLIENNTEVVTRLENRAHLILNGRHELGNELLVFKNALNRGFFKKAEKQLNLIETDYADMAQSCKINTAILREYLHASQNNNSTVIRNLQNTVNTMLEARHKEPRAEFKGPKAEWLRPRDYMMGKRVERKQKEKRAGRQKPIKSGPKKVYI
jgi:tetratricopeptide (TPR) repeat protein